MVPGVLTPWDVQSKRVYGTCDAGPTLPSGTGEGMNIQPIIITTANTNANGSNVNEDGVCYTLDGTNSNAVAIYYKQTPKVSEGVAHTLTHEGDGGIHSAVAFAQNTRDEVRLFGGDGQTVGALAAQPGVKQTSYVMTQYGDVAGTLRARADSSPCVDSGQNVVCMADGNGKTAVDEGMCGTLKVGGGVAHDCVSGRGR